MWTLPPNSFTFWMALLGAVIGALVVLAILHQTSNQVKRFLIVALTFLAGLFYFLEFFIPPDPATEEARLLGWNLTQTATTVGNAALVVGGFTFLLGLYNLVLIHGNNIRRQRPGWYNSLAFFLAFFTMAVIGFWKDWNSWFSKVQPPQTPPPAPEWVNNAYNVLFNGLLRNLDATMFSILAFYIVSAAYRAFRIRSAEAALLMIVALILMMGQVPLGMALTNWVPQTGPFAVFRIENFSQYVLTAINSPVQRAIAFGLGLGALAMALRIWLSLERGTYFGQES
jgi:hypothetical protein